MKKLLTAIVVSLSVLFMPIAQAVIPAPVGLAIGLIVGANYDKPIPAYLTDACQAKKVKAENGNYFFSSVEHCKKEM